MTSWFQRKWKNDVHMAIRDCNKARFIDVSSFKAHYYMSEALLQVLLNDCHKSVNVLLHLDKLLYLVDTEVA